jgi:hypothetical protein
MAKAKFILEKLGYHPLCVRFGIVSGEQIDKLIDKSGLFVFQKMFQVVLIVQEKIMLENETHLIELDIFA